MGFQANPVYVFLVLCLLVIVSVNAARTKWGKKVGAALLVIVFTAVVANLKLIPSASNSIPLYDGIFTYLAPIAIFYLLLSINLTSIKKAGAPMIILFIIGSLATLLGVVIAWYLISPGNILGSDGKIIAGMFTGTYTGGSVNFNAVALHYNLQDKSVLYAGTIAVDNVISTLWIIVTLVFPAILRKFWKDKKPDVKPDTGEHAIEEERMDFRSLIWLVFLGVFSYYISAQITVFIQEIPSILTLTTIGLLLAQTRLVAGLKGGHFLGLYLVYLFLAVIGAYCEVGSVFELKEVGITLLAFASLAVGIHGIITILAGSMLYRDWEMISIVSQANIGGGTTAIAMAETFNRKELILPAILVGSLGNAIGTYLGFLVIYIL